MPNQEPYCEGIIQKIGDYYNENTYENITIPLCLVGMIFNVLNVLVFTRKTMNSPPNLILTHLAFVDFLYLLSYIAEFWIALIQPTGRGFYRQQSYGRTNLYYYSDIFVCTAQFISSFLTVQLAAWRYIAVVHPLKERRWCTMKITRNIVITGYVICCVTYAIPYYLTLDIEKSSINGKTSYIGRFDQHPIMRSITGFVFGFGAKILPSFVLAGLTSRIVVTLLARKTYREQLSPSTSTRSGMKNAEKRQQTNGSTTILLAVVALFFIAEFPRGILWLLVTINDDVWSTCYYSLVQIFMTIININTSITFIIYYTMSQQFRTTFKSLFRLNKDTTSHQTPVALGDTEETESGRKTSEV